MSIITMRFRRLTFLIALFIVIILAFINFKWILSLFYPIKYQELINKYSTEYNVDPMLVASIIRVESKYYEEAQSHKDARGLMQISPITGKWASEQIGIENYSQDILYDPETNIMIGCWYLDNLRKQFNGNVRLVIAAYNGGSGNVTKWLNDERYSYDGKTLDNIPFKETKEYVEKVLWGYKIYNFIYGD